MSLRELALKPGELKLLSRAGLLLLGARLAMRVEAWAPPEATVEWRAGLDLLVASAFRGSGAAGVGEAESLARAISSHGVHACNRLRESDEPLGRCMNYAGLTLATGLRASVLTEVVASKKAIIEAAKYAGFIPAILAHAGRIRGPSGRDVVDFACEETWAAIRAEVPSVAAATVAVEQSEDRVDALRRSAPLALDWSR